MFVFHFFTGLSFVVVLDKFLFISGVKKSGPGRVRQVVVLYINNCIGICLSELCIGHLREVVVL